MSKSVAIALALFLAVAAWIGSGFLGDKPQEALERAESGPSEAPTKLASVQVQRLAVSSVDRILDLMGVTAANRAVSVSAQTKGAIVDIAVDSGMQINSGVRIAEIDPGDRKARVSEAKAMVALRQSEYDAAAKLSQKNLQSPTELIRARTNLDAAKAALESAEIELQRTSVRAPFSGVVESRLVEVGDYMDIGKPVARLLDLSQIKVLGQVSERDVTEIKSGMSATLTFIDGQTLEGKVTFVSQSSDSATRTFGIEVTAPNPDLSIAAGMTAKISLNLGAARAHQLSPAVLTLDDEGRIGVKLVDDADVVHFVPVDLVTDSPEGMWLAGLPDTADIITLGHEFVSDGQQVIAVRVTP
ncbi:MAG: efflux RND transporter periplasmic adaptor subunit [Gammaproteobacteria bacterium]|jgi:multidrug efflux system membrane fusion protein